MIVPNPLAGKFLYILGSLLFGGLVFGPHSGTYGVTPLMGGALFLPQFTSTGNPSTTLKVPVLEPYLAQLRGTGSATVKVNGGVKYPALCIPNPLTRLTPNAGSGISVVNQIFHMGNNPQNASFDITLEKSCTAGTGGTVLANNVNMASGATLTLSGSRLVGPWNGSDFIKAATTTPIDSRTTGWFSGFVADIVGE